MKNQNKTNRPTFRRHPPLTITRPLRETYRFTPTAPHHDLLVLSFYPGMDAKELHTPKPMPVDHPTAA